MKPNPFKAGLIAIGVAVSFSVGAQTTPDSGSTTGIGGSPGSDAHSNTQRGTSDIRGTEMDKLDKDKDGKVSEAEAKSDLTWSKRFKEMDGNADGMIEPSELIALDSKEAKDRTGTARSTGGKDDLKTPSY